MAPLSANGPAPGAPPEAAPKGADRPSFRHRLEYAAAFAVLKSLGALPHSIARLVCAVLAELAYGFWPRLRRVGMFNLRLAFPEWTEDERRRVLRQVFRNFGRMLADFAHFPRLTRSNIEKLIVYDGFEHFERARREGKGVLFLTAHFGSWELSSFAHGVYGYPCHFVVRPLDNPLLDELINRYRCLSGGRAIAKKDFGREVLRAFKRGDAVGVLIDQNMLAGEGVFVNFFGRLACTTTGPARIARRAGVPIVLGLVVWDEKIGKHRLRFESVEWVSHADAEEEIRLNTQNFTRKIEEAVRRWPDHWLWVHRRWKTRPPGEPPLYPF